MGKTTLQPSLFPREKGDFDSGHLMALITKYPQFEAWLRLGFTIAYEHLNQIECSMSKRLRSTNIHEFAFNELADSLTSYPDLAPQIDVIRSNAGNQKNYFSFGGYIFLLKKEDTTTNDTRMNFKIQHQEMNAHVISVEYALNPLQDAIISLRLSYYMGNQSMFSYNITLSSVVNLSSESSETIEVTPIKPKLSQKVFVENAVG